MGKSLGEFMNDTITSLHWLFLPDCDEHIDMNKVIKIKHKRGIKHLNKPVKDILVLMIDGNWYEYSYIDAEAILNYIENN